MMTRLDDRRGRQYDLRPLEGIPDERVGYAAAILDEARERCIDLIVDMSEEAMWTRPPGSPFSAGDLVIHMNWAEYVWLAKIGAHRLSEDTLRIVERGNLSNLYNPEAFSMPVGDLVGLCRETREKVMLPCLENASDLDQEIGSILANGRGPHTVRQILMHVTTSWIYHTGQVGFATMQNGLDYQWGFA